MQKHNVGRKFNLTDKQVEKLADFFINKQIIHNKIPLYTNTCKLVMIELGINYPIVKDMNKDVLDGLARFVGKTILDKYIWKKQNIKTVQHITYQELMA